jgi:hypothetical protein
VKTSQAPTSPIVTNVPVISFKPAETVAASASPSTSPYQCPVPSPGPSPEL